MPGTHLPPDKWGDAAVSWPDRFFRIRVSGESDTDRLEAALEAEAARSSPRKDRIARLNKRLAEVRDGG
jgi:hypothetical protein